MRKHATYLISTVLFLLLSVTAAFADVVELQNGDRITGTVTRLSGGTLTLKTAGGDLSIPWDMIRTLTSTAPLQVTIKGRPGKQTISAIATTAPGQLQLTPTGPVAATDITDIEPVTPNVSINGGASAGFLNSHGNTDVFALRMDGDLAIRQNKNRYSATAALNRVKDRALDRDTAKNWNTALNYDRFLNKRLFINANAIFTNDEFRDIDLRSAFGLGLGYVVVDTPIVKLTANGGLGWVKENFFVAPDDDYTAAHESVSLDVFAIPHRVEFFHKHDGYFGLEGDNKLFIKTNQGARLTVIKDFVTTFELDLDYDGSPSPGRKSTDRTLALTFGYRF
jgi:putative salt-induced outer membrane protein YdiY